MIWLTSDTHFCHDREFIWKKRGFQSVDEMNQTIIKNWNQCVSWDDDVYLLGDIMLKDNESGLKCLKQLQGRIHIALGNHDTATRAELYSHVYNIVDVELAYKLDWNKYHFYLSHYPTYTGNLEHESLSKTLINLYGHTHQLTNFFEDRPYMYHVGLDSHNNKPVSLETVLADCQAKYKECLEML